MADRLTNAVLGLAVLLLLGLPVLGIGVFAGTDVLEQFDPWATTAPDLDGIDNNLRGDEVDVRLPARRDIAEGLRRGDLPLWQSSVNGGVPLAAVPNSASLSPFNAPYWFLPMWLAPAITKLLEVVVAIAGTMALLHGYGVRRDVRVLAGFLVGFSGFTIVWTGSAVTPLTALFPLLLWSVDRALRTRTATGAVPLVLAVATGWLQGFPAVFLVELLLAGTWALCATVGTASLRTLIRPLAGLAAAVVAGTGLATFQLATFLSQFGRIETGGRAQTAADHLPFDHLLTLALPFVLGDDATWRGVRNMSEAHTWLGIVPLVLLGLWAWHGAPRATHPLTNRLSRWLTAVAASISILVWVGGWPLALAQLTPLFSINQVSRLRGIAMVAVVLLGALGLEAHLRRASVDADRRWRALRVATLAGLGITLIMVAGPDAVHAARLVGQGGQLQADIAIFVGGVGAAVALIVLARGRPAVTAMLVPALLVIGALETNRLTGNVWSDVPREAFYPSTPAHVFVQEHLGDDRTASAERAMYPGTTAWYGIRTAAGHAFPTTPWREALLAVDPTVYDGSETQALLTPSQEVASSPILDRLAVRWWITDLDHPPLGSRGTLALTESATGLEAPLPPERAFRSLVLPATVGLVDVETLVTTSVLLGDAVVANATRRLLPSRPERPVVLSVPDATGDRLVITWEGSPVPRSAVGTFDATFSAPEEPISLAFAAGALIYERLSYSPRFRWASRASVLRDPGLRIAALAAGDVPDDTVVLHDGTATGGGIQQASVEVEVADGDERRLTVEALDDGWLVIADSLQDDWVAMVDGRPAELLDADHVGVAIALAEGTHEVVLRYRPATVRFGLHISLATLVLGLGVVAWSRRRTTEVAP